MKTGDWRDGQTETFTGRSISSRVIQGMVDTVAALRFMLLDTQERDALAVVCTDPTTLEHVHDVGHAVLAGVEPTDPTS